MSISKAIINALNDPNHSEANQVIKLFLEEIIPKVSGSCHKFNICDRPSIDAVVSEAFIRALQSILNGKYKEDGKFNHFFMGIVRYILMEQKRRKQRENIVGEQHKWAAIPGSETDLDYFYKHEEDLILQEKLLRNATQECAELFQLKHIDGKSYDKIADILNGKYNQQKPVAPNTLKQRYKRCRDRLRTAFKVIKNGTSEHSRLFNLHFLEGKTLEEIAEIFNKDITDSKRKKTVTELKQMIKYCINQRAKITSHE